MKKLIIVIFVVIISLLTLVYISISENTGAFRTCEVLSIEDIEQYNFRKFDSVYVAASFLYKASAIKQILQGEQYRAAWSQPINVPIAFLDTLRGGMRVIEKGGGKQTHSLELEDTLGIRYTLRSVTKDASKLIPQIAKELNLENIIVDGISAQHPYGALVVRELSERAELLHTHPELLFVPKQKVLGEFNAQYGNRLFLFEYESEGKVNWTQLPNIRHLIDTEDLQQSKLEGNDSIKVDTQTLIRARLFDLLIGDWDRHAKQWGWAIQKEKDGFLAIPVAADRDNAFFKQDGVLPTLIANNIFLPEVQVHESDIDYLKGLVRPIDEYFLRSTSSQDFEAEANFLKNVLTDEIIDNSFDVWPHEIDNLDGEYIRANLKSRRDKIVDYALRFKQILDSRPLRKIILKGSENLELEGSLAMCFECPTDD